MRAIWVRMRIKPADRARFLEAIGVDALESERDEPGCLRFNVLQDVQEENLYYCYEVFADEAAMDAHRATRISRPGARSPMRWTGRTR
jgi:autoinducer 2-degrading protein